MHSGQVAMSRQNAAANRKRRPKNKLPTKLSSSTRQLTQSQRQDRERESKQERERERKRASEAEDE